LGLNGPQNEIYNPVTVDQMGQGAAASRG